MYCMIRAKKLSTVQKVKIKFASCIGFPAEYRKTWNFIFNKSYPTKDRRVNITFRPIDNILE